MRANFRYQKKNVISTKKRKHPIDLVSCRYYYQPSMHKPGQNRPNFFCKRCPKYADALLFACNFCDLLICQDCEIEKNSISANIAQKDLSTLEHLCGIKTIVFTTLFFSALAFVLYYGMRFLG